MTNNQTVTSGEVRANERLVGAPIEHGSDPGLDRINLEQALRDFEVANRRVIDLTHRVTSLHRELLETRDQLNRATAELQTTRRYVDRIRSSRLYPLVQVAARAKRAVRG